MSTRRYGGKIESRVRDLLRSRGYWAYKSQQAFALIPRGSPLYGRLVRYQTRMLGPNPRFAVLSKRVDAWGCFDVVGVKWGRSRHRLWRPVCMVQATTTTNQSARRKKMLQTMEKAGIRPPAVKDAVWIGVWAWSAKHRYYKLSQLTDEGWLESCMDRNGDKIERPETGRPLPRKRRPT